MARFSAADLETLAAAREVDVGWRSRSGEMRYVPIWVVIVDEAVYVRSVRGTRGRWYREVLRQREGAVRFRRRTWTVRPARVRSPELVEAVSDALARKYRGAGGSLRSMLVPEVLGTTLRLEPAV